MDNRAESQASDLSQFSESTVLDQDFAQLDLLESDLLAKPVQSKTKVTRFSLEPLPYEPKRPQVDKAVALIERLCDRPENSTVLINVRHNARKSSLDSLPDINQAPSGKVEKQPIRTTIFKDDYVRRQKKLHRIPSGEMESRVLQRLIGRPHTPQKDPIPPIGAKPQTMPEVDRTSDRTSHTESRKQLTFEEMMFGKSVTTYSVTSGSVATTYRRYETEVDEEETEKAPDTPAAVPPPVQTPEEEMRPATPKKKRASSAKGRADPDIILTYKRKNKYDIRVPDNDDVIHNIKELRARLGWPTEIPRHGTGAKAALEKLVSRPRTEQGSAMTQPDQSEAVRSSLPPGIKQVIVVPELELFRSLWKGHEEMLTMKDDDGHFLYCLLRNRHNPRARYDPYNLQVVSADEARRSRVYWTISASRVSRCVQGKNGKDESTNISVLWWLWERRLFYMIHEIPVFVEFRIWKTFKIWQANVREQKNKCSKGTLFKTLFLANEVLQGCLIHVRTLCEVAAGHSDEMDKVNRISLVDLDHSQIFKLPDFLDRQRAQSNLALAKLGSLRDKIVEIVWESCATVAEMEGVRQDIRPDSKVRIKVPVELKKSLEPAKGKEGDLQKRSRPLYAEIAEWRKILKRLECFLHYVDYILMDLLQHLVLQATEQLRNFLMNSYNCSSEDDQVSSISSTENEDSLTEEKSSSGGSEVEDNLDKEVEDSVDESEGYGREKNWNPESVSSMQTESESEKPDEEENQTVTASGYVVPHYDFNKQEVKVKPPDIDEVLDELRHRKEVKEVIFPIFEVVLQLNVPKSRTGPGGSRRQSRKSVELRPSKVHWDLPGQNPAQAAVRRRSVKFTVEDLQESDSNSESVSESEESDVEISESPYAYAGRERSERRRSSVSHKTVVTIIPSEDDFLSGIEEMVANFEITITQIVPMMREPRLEVFYSPPKMDLRLNVDQEKEEEMREMLLPWPDLDLLIRDDPRYCRMQADLRMYLDMEMELIRQYITYYDQFCVMVDQSRHMEASDMIGKKEMSTEEFNHLLATQTEMVRRMHRMTVERRVGMVQVSGEIFQRECLPFPQKILDIVNHTLPIIANKRNEDLLTIIKGASRKLDHPLTSVEEFVDHLSFLGKMTTELPALEKEFNVVNKLFTIARDYNVPLAPESLALYQTLGSSFQHLKSTILFCEAKKDENIHKFSADLDHLISDIRVKLIELKTRVRDPDLLHADTMAVSALESIKYLQDEVQALSLRARSYASYQERFGSSLSQSKKGYDMLIMDRKSDMTAQDILSDLSEVERDITLRRLLWQSQEDWTKLYDEWTTTRFESVNVEVLQKSVNKFIQTIYMLEKGLPPNEVLPSLKVKVMDFKLGMSVIISLRNSALRKRHWTKIEKIIGKTIIRDKAFTLGNLLDMNINKHKEIIQDISTTASNENTLVTMLDKIITLWNAMDFRLLAHISRETFILAGTDDIITQLEESLVTIATIRGSRYVEPIKTLVDEWERKLVAFNRTLDEWLNCQRNYLYLEQIFSTPDIQRQLPAEHKMFTQVDKSWRDIMRRVEDRPNALKSAIAPGTLETLQSCNASLEKIQKCLEEYLETKRLVFPRFYFLSNDELLDILAQSKDPNAVQPHLAKCFGNIKSLDIKQIPRQPPTVKYISSAEGEVIAMPRNVRARGPVEQWLGTVEAGMFETVKKHLKVGLSDYQSCDLQDWVLKHPGQVVLTVLQIMFNKDVCGCFEQAHPLSALSECCKSMVTFLNKLAGMVDLNLLNFQRFSMEAVLIVSVHNRDILVGMVDERITSIDDFEWKKQLRYEWDEQTNNCQVQQSNASFQYGYEYLGCSQRLVITTLTDRCYLTLTGAMHLHLGGSPAGPAGTGKTETVKDLAKAMGKQCVVFNCSEGLDYKTLGKFFSGLSQSGSWCCFDEFNRIDVEVLSVVAQQIQTIKSAKDGQSLRFMFEGRDIKLNMTCGYFITMNPTYAGRVELPDNLKSLFRSVAMMVPDYVLIAEIILFSEGFVTAKSLSQKVVNLYYLASTQLSQQDHYDFGMRAIKSVLIMAGHNRRKASEEHQQLEGEQQEAFILMHALQDANLPKFLAEDVPLFDSILADVFPGLTAPKADFGKLEKAISMSVRDHGLQHWPNQIDKVKQLYSQIMVRHGIMLVGPTGGGKTTVRQILHKALVVLPTIALSDSTSNLSIEATRKPMATKSRKGRVESFNLNPKCVTLGELYGNTDPNTFEWTDGLIAKATRKLSKQSSGEEGGRDSRPNTAMTGASELTHRSQGSASGMTEPSSAPDMLSLSPQSGMTREEQEGVDSLIDWQWIILDGPVDTLWVENLNTVLDDSKVLCLASGERISLTPSMRLLFEVDNLSQASPATISRCAMVYLDPVDLGWKPYVKTWLQRLPRDIPDSGKSYLEAMFYYALDKGLTFTRNFTRLQVIPVPETSIVACLCHILSAYIYFMQSNGGFGKADKEGAKAHGEASHKPPGRSTSKERSKHRKTPKKGSRKDEDAGEDLTPDADTKVYYLQKHPGNLTNLLGKLFVFAFTWSFGGIYKRQEDMDDDDNVNKRGSDVQERDVNICNEFDNFMRETFEVEPPLGVRLPTGNRSIYAYFVDMESGNFVPWDQLIPSTKSLIEKGAVITIGETMGVASQGSQENSGMKEAEIVQTVDILRFSFLASLLVFDKHPVLLTGDSGIGKSTIITNLLKRMEKEGVSHKDDTALGTILNYTEKKVSILESISMLTKLDSDTTSDEKSLDELISSARAKGTGILTTTIQFSAQTSAARVQTQIMHKLIKKGRDSMGAPKGKRLIVFVDDLNMPAPEEYGAQPPLELIRQFIECGGFFDTKKLVWKDIVDVTLLAACGPPGGGRNPTSPRLIKHFCTFALPTPSTRSLQHIYQVQLGCFLQEGNFMPEVTECLFSMVSASIAVYYRMCSSMLPTPAKSHYTFNVRDLSQVVQGLLQAHNTVIVSRESCALLFAHEATRVFHDRLIDREDRMIFCQILSDNLHDYFKVTKTPEKLMNEPILFGDFFDLEDTTTTERIYRSMADGVKLRRVLEDHYLRITAGSSSSPQFVFFQDAMEHIVRAARVFRQPGGHLLLVGLDGAGKSTVVSLASTIAGCELFRLNLHKHYNTPEFRDDLKKVFLQAGVKGITTTFLLTDADIFKESFLEDINSILNSGEVPDLFDNEELEGVMVELKRAAGSNTSITDTRAAMYDFFIQRVRQRLHVVLTMSPAGGKFRQRCRMNPALINCCTIDWYNEWTDDAMIAVARAFFENTDFLSEVEEEGQQPLKERVAQMCMDIHKTIADMKLRYWNEMRRRYYSTPSSYMELIRLYSRLIKDNKKNFLYNRNRLQMGLDKLSEANSLVGIMQEELKYLGPQIEQKAKDTEYLLEELQKDEAATEEVRKLVQAEENIMSHETSIVQTYADDCESDLASVLPALQEAISSLETLDKASISEIRVYANPPELVATVMAAVCMLFGKKTDWATAKQLVGDPNLLKKLLSFDKNSVSDKTFTKLKKYSKNPDFNPEAVGKVSLACKSLCAWVLALEHYHEVYKMVKPKQKRVAEAREALGMAQANLSAKQASLAKIEGHLRKIQDRYQASVNEREALKERKRLTGLRLIRASVLTEALADEKVRWSESVKLMDVKLEGLVGDTLLMAAAVAYIGPFTAKYRRHLLTQWLEMCQTRNIPVSSNFELVRSMVEQAQVMKWHNEGLPRDSHSTENALILKKSRKWPLMIDPQGQALNWVKQMEGSALKVVTATDPNLMRTMETALRVGDSVLIKDVKEELDPALRPVLLQETFMRSGNLVIMLGETEIEFNSNFRLYLDTELPNPHYLPAIFIQVNIMNFTVTFEGLQEQLLSEVVKQEQPHLELQRMELLESIANDRQALLDLENKSLELLHKTEGHILDDEDLVQTLQRSKVMAGEILSRVSQSEMTEKNLDEARRQYLPVATRGAVLYFVLAELSTIDVMYQFSLSWFQDMFTFCISTSDDQTQESEGIVSLASQEQMELEAGSALRRPSKILDSEMTPPSFPAAEAQPPPASHPKVVIHAAESLEEPLEAQTADPNAGQQTRDIDGNEKTTNPKAMQEHLLAMINRLTFSIYRVVSVGLFAHHQLSFSFMICSSIMRANAQSQNDLTGVGAIEDLEWQIFLQGNVMATMMDEVTLSQHDGLSPTERIEAEAGNVDVVKRPPKWLMDHSWQQCRHLEASIETFQGLCYSLIHNHEQWDAFWTAEDPYAFLDSKYVPPAESDVEDEAVFKWENLKYFHRVLLVKVVRLEMVPMAVASFIEQHLGTQYLSTGSFDLREIYEESTAKTPLIFILSPDCDPSTQLLRFARELRGSTLHLDMISLGRGQGPKAEELIAKAQILKGRWVFLQNCHLAASWMPRLQNIVENFNKPGGDIDPQFRLWLSSKPDPSFPTSILQTGMKMTIEPPRGLRANMLRSFGTHGAGEINEKLFEEGVGAAEWKPLLFSLCLFNGVIHERRKYGTLGWNISYGFNDSDLQVSILKLQMLLDHSAVVPWKALKYLTGEVTFGGRVTDDLDRRCLLNLLEKFYDPASIREGHCFTRDGVYKQLPSSCSFSDALAYIETLPIQDSPEMFGMTENAERACREYQAQDLLNTLISVQPRLYSGLPGSQKSSDTIVLEVAAGIMKMLPKTVEETLEVEEKKPGAASSASTHGVPPSRTLRGILSRVADPPPGAPSSLLTATEEIIGKSALVTVLRQEIDRFDQLLMIIHQSLDSLIHAVKGDIVMSDALEDAYHALLSQAVPSAWKVVAYESRKQLSPWVVDLNRRVNFLSTWAALIVESIEKRAKLLSRTTSSGADQAALEEKLPAHPRAFWLSGFFFPQGFLTAVLQNHSRRVNISVDSLRFEFHVLPPTDNVDEDPMQQQATLVINDKAFNFGTKAPEEGVLIFGLYLDGASWSKETGFLADSRHHRFANLPEIHFLPVKNKPRNPSQSRTETPLSKPPSPAETSTGAKSATPTETSTGAKSATPTETSTGAKPASPTETSTDAKPASPTETSTDAKPASPTETSPDAKSPPPEETSTGATPTSPTEMSTDAKPASPMETSPDAESPLPAEKSTGAKYSYECPLYRTSSRAGTLSSTGHSTNFVTTVNLPSSQPPSFWVLRGVAMLCQLDE